MTRLIWLINLLFWVGVLMLDAMFIAIILPSPSGSEVMLVLMVFALAIANLIQVADTPIERE